MIIRSHLSPDLVRQLEGILQYTFKNEELRDKMLEVAGSTPEPGGNRILALVGDAVLKVVLSTYGYSLGFDQKAINNLHQTIGANANLSRQGFAKGLDIFIRKNPAQGDQVFGNPRATTVEAIIGAVYIDSDYDFSVVRGVIIRLGLLEE